MNKNVGLFIIALFCIQGCATSQLLQHTSKTETYYLSNAQYVDGVISENKHALLCFNSHSPVIGDYTFMIECPVTYLYNDIDKVRKRIKNNGISAAMTTVPTPEIVADCNELPVGENIVIYNRKRPINIKEWSAFSKNHKDSPLFIQKDISTGKWATLYLPLEDDLYHNLYFGTYSIDVSCKVCYAGVPFTFIFDVITFPVQAIGYLVISAGMRH